MVSVREECTPFIGGAWVEARRVRRAGVTGVMRSGVSVVL